jgi:hypothetical protein
MMLAAPATASAEWLVVRNDTGKAIVLQETVIVRGKMKRGKATNLLPGETYRQFVPGATVKNLQVFHADNRDVAVWSGNLNCKDGTQLFSVRKADSKVKVVAVERRDRE